MGGNKIANILSIYKDINSEWLLTGKGNMLKQVNELNKPTSIYKLRTDLNKDQQLIPLYNIEAAAGLKDLFQNEKSQHIIDTIKIPNLPKCDGALFVVGDSMYPLLKSGDVVIYKIVEDYKNDIYWGNMYLISVQMSDDEYISVKYIQKSDLGKDYVCLVSENKHHQSKDVQLCNIRALALVKASVRINTN